jgi:hypothetical protein
MKKDLKRAIPECRRGVGQAMPLGIHDADEKAPSIE